MLYPIRRTVAVALVGALLAASSLSSGHTLAQAPPDPPCEYVYWVPFHDITTTCLEVVYGGVPIERPRCGQ